MQYCNILNMDQLINQTVNNIKYNLQGTPSNPNYMLGKLNARSATVLLNSMYTIASFGTHLHIFHRSSQTCQAMVSPGHESDIKAVSVSQPNGNVYTVTTLDEIGILVITEITVPAKGHSHKTIAHKTVKKQQTLTKSKQHAIITSAIIAPHTIFCVTGSSTLHTYNLSNSALASPYPSIKFTAVLGHDDHVYITDVDSSIAHVLKAENAEYVSKYNASCGITAMIQVQDSLVIGDERGKITIVYQYFKQQSNQQSKVGKNKRPEQSSLYSAVLEWHTSPIKALACNGNYLYSGADESVIVVWHIRDLSRDFLPRVGAPITSLSVCQFSNQILCTLSDNSFRLIDLGNDKQVFSYRTIVDPWGYAPTGSSRFSTSTTASYEGVLCLKGLPGRLQFIDTTKNGLNWELEIVGRNLINSINGDELQPHRVEGFAFSKNWNALAVSVQTTYQSYLKFYKRMPAGYELSTRIDSPHSTQSSVCVAFIPGTSARFATWSQGDNVVRVWGEHSQKKKSIVDVTQNYWRCEQEVSHRELPVTAVSVNAGILVVIYVNSEIVVYQASDNADIQQIGHFSGTDIKEANIISIQSQKGHKTLKLLVRTPSSMQIHSLLLTVTSAQPSNKKSKQNKPNTTLVQRLKVHEAVPSFVIAGNGQLTIVIQSHEKSISQIVTVDRKSAKFTDSYECDSLIETGFYLANHNEPRLILIDSHLKLCSIDSNPIIKYSESLDEDNSTQWAEQTGIQSDGLDIYKLNARWVIRESIKNNSRVEDAIEGMECMPGGSAAWMQIASKLIL